jgi:hypothetical protein
VCGCLRLRPVTKGRGGSGVGQLRAAVEDGWRNHPYVRASAPGASDVAIVHPAHFQMLQVSFHLVLPPYSELISRPGLVAFVSVDRSTGRFMGVKFKHMP